MRHGVYSLGGTDVDVDRKLLEGGGYWAHGLWPPHSRDSLFLFWFHCSMSWLTLPAQEGLCPKHQANRDPRKSHADGAGSAVFK